MARWNSSSASSQFQCARAFACASDVRACAESPSSITAVAALDNAIVTIDVDGRRVDVQNWRGSLNHNWGRRHTDHYAWGQVAGFDNAPDVFLECATARLRFDGIWTPAMTLVVLRIGSEELRLNSPLRALRTKRQTLPPKKHGNIPL